MRWRSTRARTPLDEARAVDVERDGDRVSAVVFESADDERFRVACRRLVVADGVRSPLGRVLGREWHRETAYGVAARGYVRSGRSDDEWISSHLELRGDAGRAAVRLRLGLPVGAAAGEVNIGVGTLATARRPAGVQLKSLLETYTDARREEWRIDGPVRAPASALLPMGGAVSGVAGRNWALIGDAAGCVNPLNGEGIDYGLETGRSVVELFERGRLVRGVARDPAPALRRGVLDRPPAGRSAHPAAVPPGGRSGRHALTVADDGGPARDGQPRHRRRPRRCRPGLAYRREGLGQAGRSETVQLSGGPEGLPKLNST